MLSRSNSEDPGDIERKLVLCVHLLRCVYIFSVLVQQCVHLRSTAMCTLFTQYRDDVCTFAEYSYVYICLGVYGHTVVWKSKNQSPARAREPRGPSHQPGSFRGLRAFIC